MPLPAVVPAPVSLSADGGEPFVLGPETPASGDPDATATLAALLAARTGRTIAADSPADQPAIALIVAPGGAAESYTIEVDAASVVVTGADAAGLFYGVQTLAQLITRRGDEWIVPAVSIADEPRFSYRGFMLDVARHFHPVETVKACIERAAALKLNTLHLHLTDDQGWRLALRSRPLLTERASGSAVGGDVGGFYTHDDFREIVEFAASRHMLVVPEIDVPGHTHAVGLAYPGIVADPVITDAVRDTVRTFGGELPESGRAYDGMAVGFSSLKIHDERTYDFLADVFGELASLTPGPYLHFGGDEALGTPADDFAEFVSRVSSIIADLDKVPVAWHEAGAARGIDDETVGQYWGFVTPDEKADAAARGFAQLILSPADAVYLDMKPTADSDIGLTWANGPTSVERAYGWEPTGILHDVAEDDILGVEAPLWTETVRTLADIDRLAFPRIAAAAEIAWSPRPEQSPLRTWDSFRTRVGALGALWTTQGIGFDRSAEIPWQDAR